MNDFKLSNIKIGYADGEKEAEEDNFSDLFYTDNNKYNELLSKYKFIVSGRKGTGKTILAKYYQKINNNGSFIIDYSKLDKISLHQFIDLDSINLNNDIRFLFHEYYIHKHFVETILKNKKNIKEYFFAEKNNVGCFKALVNFKKYIKVYRNLYNLYKEYYPDGSFNDKEKKTIQKIIENSSVDAELSSTEKLTAKLGTTTFNGNENVLEIVKEKKNFAERSEQYKKHILECLKYISVSIIIDDLDEIKTEDTEHLISLLINLVTKVNDINMTFLKVNSKSKCILLLRSDIINLFASRSANIQKIISDSNIELDWFKNDEELENMIMYKISKSDTTHNMSKQPPKIIKKIIFEKSNNNLFNTSFDKIIRFSFGRPRDLITYIDCVIEQYPNAPQISFKMLKDSEQTYSQKIVNEIKNEMSIQLSSEEIEDIMNLLRNYGKAIFKYDEITEYFNTHSNLYKNIENINTVLQYLYQLGIIGNSRLDTQKRRETQKKRRYIYTWSYRNGGPTLNMDWDIVIHFSIRKALNIV